MFGRAVVGGLLVVAIVASAGVVQAVVTIETVPVGNPGNAPDTRYYSMGIGAVSYSYQIGKYEVTNAQYCEFLNAKLPTINDEKTDLVLPNDTFGLYNCKMETAVFGGIGYNPDGLAGAKFFVKPGYGNMPVVYVCWYDAIRFTNWLQNGQGNGDTESGTYTISGSHPFWMVAFTDSTTRASWNSPHWMLPSEDEWYKAAYHMNDGVTGDYWDYPTGTNTRPYSDKPGSLNSPTNSANYLNDDGIVNGYNDGWAVTGSPTWDSAQNYLTDVGAYGESLSPYGTMDQGGNVWEWNDGYYDVDGASRGFDGVLCGGSFNGSVIQLHASSSYAVYARANEHDNRGFRVALVPEPSSIVLLVTAVLGLFVWRLRRNGR